ncbi:hypothetical protein BH09PSE5_BH09PSE5_27450 [soil metagenome]
MKRMTKADFPSSLGAFKPVGHVVVVLPDDAGAQKAASAFVDAGFAADDVLLYSSEEVQKLVGDQLGDTSGGAGFGSEIQLMRQHHALASEGAAWVIVFAPEDEQTEKVAEVAKAHGAKLATKYNRLMIEDLITLET